MYRRNNNKKQTNNILLIATAFLFVSTFLIRLYFSGIFATKNQELANIIAEKAVLEKEVSTLEYEDSELSSLSNVEKRATALGFKTFKGNVLSLDIKSTVPLAAKAMR